MRHDFPEIELLLSAGRAISVTGGHASQPRFASFLPASADEARADSFPARGRSGRDQVDAGAMGPVVQCLRPRRCAMADSVFPWAIAAMQCCGVQIRHTPTSHVTDEISSAFFWRNVTSIIDAGASKVHPQLGLIRFGGRAARRSESGYCGGAPRRQP